MENLTDKIQSLSEGSVFEVLKELHSVIFEAIEFQEVVNNSVKLNQVDIQYLIDLEVEKKTFNNDIEVAGPAAKELLLCMAENDAFSELIRNAINKVENDAHLGVIAAVITIGLLVNLTLLVATTKVEYIDGKLSISKGVVEPELMKEVVLPVKVLAEKVKVF